MQKTCFLLWATLFFLLPIHSYGSSPRVVALEFSFAEDLLAIGIVPVGIADDGRPSQLYPALQTLKWTSVGSRAQPDLEQIAALHPTLIIADPSRHQLIEDQLKHIAPVLMLPSRRASYSENMQAAQSIADALGLTLAMKRRLQQHQNYLAHLAIQLNKNQHASVLFLISRGPHLFAHARDSYIGGLLKALTLEPADTGFSDSQPSRQINIEQLLAIDPKFILLGQYGHHVLSKQWRHDPLWNILSAVQQHHVYPVNGHIWVKGRGILSAEWIAQQIANQIGAAS
ncbi:Fe(3+) dicitrate ABC transporter substrate-binding protein [Celerinatantimonas sp. YJH-8]|uniref:ABC transporter substrate-binding protein n=1 Tax=Celerinatantimonas sp. YJH-8 TaxID=3228714 RepID=UPI0038C48953